jgi:hypothetical protein
MSIYIRWSDGQEYGAADWDGLIRIVKLDVPLVPDPTPDIYMSNVAWRTVRYQGYWLEYTNAETFFYELLRVGLVTEIRTGRKDKKSDS